jgi:hypothetical protein
MQPFLYLLIDLYPPFGVQDSCSNIGCGVCVSNRRIGGNELNAIILNRRRLNTLTVRWKAAQSAPQTQWTDQGTRGRPMASASRRLADAKARRQPATELFLLGPSEAFGRGERASNQAEAVG